MKLLLMGDLHLKGKTPIGRKDNFPLTQLAKLRQVEEIRCKYVSTYSEVYGLQAGDVFDSSNPSDGVKIDAIKAFRNRSKLNMWGCVLGQHDLYMWNKESAERGAVAILEEANVLTILGADPWFIPGKHIDCVVFGCSWGQTVPVPDCNIGSGPKLNVLVIHGTIGDVPLFPGHGITHPETFLRAHPEYDLILCGDYHFPFEYRVDDRVIVNAGVLCRKSRAEKSIEPSVVLFDVDSRETEWIKLDVCDDVWKSTQELVSDCSVDVSGLADMLGDGGEISLSFEANIIRALNDAGLDDVAKKVVTDILNKCKEA